MINKDIKRINKVLDEYQLILEDIQHDVSTALNSGVGYEELDDYLYPIKMTLQELLNAYIKDKELKDKILMRD